MNIEEHDEQGISPATRERIDAFSRELALVLKRILSETKDQKHIHLPDAIKAHPVSEEKEQTT